MHIRFINVPRINEPYKNELICPYAQINRYWP